MSRPGINEAGQAVATQIGRTEALDALAVRIAQMRAAASFEDGPPDTHLSELVSVYEELRAADEELRIQQDALQTLVDTQTLDRWRQDRLVAAMPVAIVVSDADGRVRTANAATADLMNLRIAQLLSRSVQSLFAESDRPAVLRLLADVKQSGELRRMVVRIAPDGLPPIETHLAAVVRTDAEEHPTDISWVIAWPKQGQGQASAAVAAAFSEMVVLPSGNQDSHAVLQQMATLCGDALGPDITASVTIGEPVEPTATATDTKLAQRVDGAQMLADEGPCQSAWESRRTVRAVDLTSDGRWPRLAAALEGIDVAGACAVPVEVGDELVGVLNLYSPRAGAFDDESVVLAELFAGAASAVIHEIRLRAELEATAVQLNLALESRAVIDQAKGILMERYEVNAEKAFAMLVQASRDSNRKVRDLARGLVDGTEDERVLTP